MLGKGRRGIWLTFLPICDTTIVGSDRWIVQSELLLYLEAACSEIGVGGVGGAGCRILALLDSTVLIQVDLARGLGERLKGTPALREILYPSCLAIDVHAGADSGSMPAAVCVGGGPGVGDTMELQACSHAIRVGYSRAFLGDVRSQAIDAALGKILAALLAGVGVSVAVVVEFWPAHKVFQDEGVRLSAHCARREGAAGGRARRLALAASAAKTLGRRRMVRYCRVSGSGGIVLVGDGFPRWWNSALPHRRNSSHRLIFGSIFLPIRSVPCLMR